METKLLVKTAFKKYKQNVYYEQLDLFQREKLADYEYSKSGDEKYKKIINIVNKLQTGRSQTKLIS